MDELYIKLRKHVYERLDIGRDVADSELYDCLLYTSDAADE